MAINSYKRTAPLKGLFFYIFFIFLNTTQAQQFVNGRLIGKKISIFPISNQSGLYKKHGREYRTLYAQDGCFLVSSTDYSDFFEWFKINGFDTLAHQNCFVFRYAKNREYFNGPYSRDSSGSVHINFNGDTLSDFGFSLKLNAPLLKDSSYDLTFLIQSFDPWMHPQHFYNKNLSPYEDFKIKITQSNSPNIEGDEIAVIRRPDVYGIDTTTASYLSFYPRNSPWYSLDQEFYTVKKTIKGINNGSYITIKAKLVITDQVSTLFRRNYKPSVLNCQNRNALSIGLFATKFEFKCPFKIKQTGSLCSRNNPLKLESNNNHISDKYLWSNGDTTASMIAANPGMYWLNKNRNGCQWIDTIMIDTIKTVANKTILYTKCKDTLIKIGLDSLAGQINFLWANGIQNSHIIVDEPNIYLRKSTLDACPIIDSFIVSYYPKHKVINAFNYTLCTNDSIIIKGLANNVEWYRQNLMFSNLKEIQINGKNNDTIILKSFTNCWQYDTIYINIADCPKNIIKHFFTPNAFSPNDDGSNEEYNPTAPGWERKKMSIYNRWGELIFTTQKPTLGWNGEYKNSLVSEGVYLVKITFKANDNATGTNPYFYWSGTVTLLK